jgi:type I restriction enzyme R subunit
MNPFTESTTTESLLRDALTGGVTKYTSVGPGFARKGGKLAGLGWHYLSKENIPRQTHEVFVEQFVRDTLIRLNPEIAAEPDRAEEVLYRLRAIILAVRSDGLIKANEEMTAWLRGDRSMPFGENHEHVTIRLIDFDNFQNNHYVLTSQYTFRAGEERRADLVLLVNGFPLVLIECKTPVRQAVSWFDGAVQVHDDYETNVPELFVANVFSVASEGKELRYGSIRLPVNLWGPWRTDELPPTRTMADVAKAARGLFEPRVLLDILANFTLFATDKKKRRIKVVCRYQQYEGANAIVDRVVAGKPRKGLIWHFQGSGKSLLMVFAAQKLRMMPKLKNPTVIIIVDRIDLDAQISSTFHASDIPNLVKAETRYDLERMLVQDTRKIIITTIFRFGEAEGVLNPREKMVLPVHNLRIAMQLGPDEKSATAGQIGGIINAEDLVNELRKVIGSFDSSLCDPNSPTGTSVLNQIRQAADILQDGTQDPAKECDGISIGLGFTMKAAQLGKVVAPELPKDPCTP